MRGLPRSSYPVVGGLRHWREPTPVGTLWAEAAASVPSHGRPLRWQAPGAARCSALRRPCEALLRQAFWRQRLPGLCTAHGRALCLVGPLAGSPGAGSEWGVRRCPRTARCHAGASRRRARATSACGAPAQADLRTLWLSMSAPRLPTTTTPTHHKRRHRVVAAAAPIPRTPRMRPTQRTAAGVVWWGTTIPPQPCRPYILAGGIKIEA